MENAVRHILVAPLNWGLGHATRCIPIIRALEQQGFTPVIASDGIALQLLQQEFPWLKTVTLPSYGIEYGKKAAALRWKLLKNSPKMIRAIADERKAVSKLIKEYDLKGIISDNRWGVYSKEIPSVFVTHQLRVLSGKTTWISSKLQQYFIGKFNECWIPDAAGKPNLTGKLGHLPHARLNLKYLGPLSRLERKTKTLQYDLMVILSGPEPQRTILEDKLTVALQNYPRKVIFIKGKVASEQQTVTTNNITYYNFMTSAQIETAMNESDTVLCRSGYTTVMDLAKLQKKAFFIPTPGQFEQEYLAQRFKRKGMAPFATQEAFRLENLSELSAYSGLPSVDLPVQWQRLFVLFEGK